MAALDFDVIVIGGGLSGGLPAAAYLQKAGLQVLVVEANAELGSFCCTHETWPQVLDSPHVGVSFAGNSPVSADKYARPAHAFGVAPGLGDDAELARVAIEFIRRLNRDLGVPTMREPIGAEDLPLLGRKAEQNTSTPSNPRPADAAAFTAMFVSEMGA